MQDPPTGDGLQGTTGSGQLIAILSRYNLILHIRIVLRSVSWKRPDTASDRDDIEHWLWLYIVRLAFLLLAETAEQIVLHLPNLELERSQI